jgi:protein PhnA
VTNAFFNPTPLRFNIIYYTIIKRYIYNKENLMPLEKLKQRSSVCELCGSDAELSAFEVAPSDGSAEQSVLLCSTCKSQIENPETIDDNHWHCLNDSMWSGEPAVQVLSYRMLHKLGKQDMLDMLYLEDELKKWADAGLNDESLVYKDSNGVVLEAGDSVTIIKDLDVKGTGFTAKRGTVVKNISLAEGDPEHVLGKVNGTRIFIKCCFVKK